MTRLDFVPMLRYVLAPLVRIAIGCGITYQSFSRLVREAYFDVASDFEPVKGKPNSDSRISVLTGLPRREVRSLREQRAGPTSPSFSFERLLLNAWSSRLDLMDEQGNMLPLPRTIRRGGDRSFEALVASIGKDVRSRAVLDEWLRKGFVVLDEEDRVVVNPRSQVSGIEGTEGASILLTHLLHDLLAGFDRHYITGQTAQDFSFHVIYGHRLSEESVTLICASAYREAMQLANKLNRLVVEREALDARLPDASRRVTFGFGVYQTDQRQEPGVLNANTTGDARVEMSTDR